MGCSIPTQRKVVKTEKMLSSREISVTPGTFLRMSRTSNYEDYVEIRKIGAGAFATVMLCFHKPTKSNRAVKIIHKSGLTKQQRDPIFMLKEIHILKKLDHPNILKCYEVFEDSLRYYVATEFCPGGDLFIEITKMKKFTEAQAAEIIFQTLSGLIYCHDKRVIHRDLKPENILLLEKGASFSIKIADFGSSCILDPDHKLNGCFGSAYYLAPEVLKDSYDEKCDVWSVGIILYILLTGKPPYSGKDSHAIIEEIKEFPILITPGRCQGLNYHAVDLLQKLLVKDVDQRITARDAIMHPWIQQQRNLKTDGNADLQSVLVKLKDFNCESKLKEAVQVFLASQVVSYQDIKAFKRSFQLIDKDGDGKITKSELLVEYQKIMSLDEADKLTDEIIEKLDQDNDGNIDYTEFLVSCMNNQKHISTENLEIAFKMFDIDGSGTITPDEIRAILENGQLAEENAWKELLQEADTNGDGCIDLKEFIALMTLKNPFTFTNL